MDNAHEFRHLRGWLLTWGIISIVAGMAAITYSVIATLVSVIYLGWLMIFVGVLEFVYAIRHRERGHLTLYLLEALLALVLGILLMYSPVRGAIVLTMLLAAYFFVSGIFRVGAALAWRLPHWGWLLVSGIINIGLGIIVWAGWPGTGLWVLGLFLGINLLFSGWARVMLALAMKSDRMEPATI
jgi:uncharacterized membrane protein HdeD (DUF308 family)